jgi:hypothetical protein
MSEHTELVVYTNSIGHPFELPPTIPDEKIKYICFSDKSRPTAFDWEVIVIEPIFKGDLFRSSREPKILAHKFLKNYQKSIYIDTRVKLKESPLALWNYLIPEPETIFGGFLHSKRFTLVDEFEAVLNQNLDSPSVIKAQFNEYKRHQSDVLLIKPVWGGILARRHNDSQCIDAMHAWYSHVLRYSRRDQLSLPLALKKIKSRIRLVADSVNQSIFHRWPVGSPEKPNYYYAI